VALKLEELTPGAQVTGLVGSGHPVTVIQAQRIGGNALRLTRRTLDSRLDERTIYRAHEPRLDLHTARPAYEFRADARLSKLAVEALRIRMAGRCDPMLTVHTSNLEPLPQQIQADCGKPLTRTPLQWQLRSML
jgi:hypothetical protein